MKSPVFSIIIPTYNSEATIAKALDSVLGQSFDGYEILIIDGKSTDNTVSIVNAYKLNSPTIQLISEPDSGIYDAMNKGVRLASGDWLYFLGSDDYLFDSEVLQSVFDFIEKGNYDVLYGQVHSSAFNGLYDGAFDYVKLTRKNICHQAIFFNKNVFKIIGDFDISFTSVADWHHNIRWFYNSKIKHHYIDLTIAEYADGGYSSHNRDQKFLDMKYALLFNYGFFKLPLSELISVTTKLVKKYKSQNHYFYFFVYGIILFFLKVKNLFTRV